MVCRSAAEQTAPPQDDYFGAEPEVVPCLRMAYACEACCAVQVLAIPRLHEF